MENYSLASLVPRPPPPPTLSLLDVSSADFEMSNHIAYNFFYSVIAIYIWRTSTRCLNLKCRASAHYAVSNQTPLSFTEFANKTMCL